MNLLKFGAKGDAVITLQKQLINRGFKGKDAKPLISDGDYGLNTEYAVRQFQKSVGLVDDGKAGDKTLAALADKPISKFLRDEDYKKAALRLKISELAIRAFGATESLGKGFLANGKAKILFERHKMYAYISKAKGKAFAAEQMRLSPNLVNITTGGYKGKEAEYVRLNLAMNIHPESALMSCSWGAFQIMGENWKDLGYQSVFDFVEQMQTSESLQLEAFIRFIETKEGQVDGKPCKLIDALRQQDWHAVFSLYNGSAYKKLGYQTKFQDELYHLESLGYAA